MEALVETLRAKLKAARTAATASARRASVAEASLKLVTDELSKTQADMETLWKQTRAQRIEYEVAAEVRRMKIIEMHEESTRVREALLEKTQADHIRYKDTTEALLLRVRDRLTESQKATRDLQVQAGLLVAALVGSRSESGSSPPSLQ